MTGPRIVVNALSARTGGGLTYARNLLRALERFPGTDVQVWVAPGQRDLLEPGPYQLVECPAPGRSIVHQLLWERFAVPRRLRETGADVYYVLSGTLAASPPPGCRSVVAFRNLLPFAPEFRRRYRPGYIRLRLWTLRRTQARSMARADLVIFVSEHGREVVDRLLPERRGRSVVIPHGVGEAFVGPRTSPRRDRRWPDGYVFYASILDVYKAQLEVVEAWAGLRSRRETREKLVLAGPEYEPYGRRVRRRIEELGLAGEVVWLGPVGHGELPGLYRGARINVFASRCENCPNILLEILASGRPTLCSSDPPMPEFGGDAVLYFDPTRPRELEARLLELLDDPRRQEALAARAHERSGRYRVDEAMQRTWEALIELGSADAPAARR